MKFYSLFAAVGVALATTSGVRAVDLFTDNFNSAASSANYNQVSFGETAVTHAYDYSTLGIPAAPNTTDGSTLGVKFEANMTAGAAAAVTLHTVQQFSGSYTVKFDGWINANGPFPLGGTGSTQFLTAGVGGDGTTVNRLNATGSGGWMAVDGEGQSGIDYRLVKGSALQLPNTGQYAAGTHSTARSAADPYYAQFGEIDVAELPVQGANQGGPTQQTGITAAGTFGFEWHEVELVVDSTGGTGGATSMAWFIDGLEIGTLDAGNGASFPTGGSVTLGYSDPFNSISDNISLSFGLIDNVVVSTVSPPANNPDFNGNTVVDAADFVIWRDNEGLTGGATQSQGDANGDMNVDATDYDLWRAAFGNNVPGSGAVVGGVVPEPSTVVLVLLGLAALTGRRQR